MRSLWGVAVGSVIDGNFKGLATLNTTARTARRSPICGRAIASAFSALSMTRWPARPGLRRPVPPPHDSAAVGTRDDPYAQVRHTRPGPAPASADSHRTPARSSRYAPSVAAKRATIDGAGYDPSFRARNGLQDSDMPVAAAAATAQDVRRARQARGILVGALHVAHRLPEARCGVLRIFKRMRARTHKLSTVARRRCPPRLPDRRSNFCADGRHF